jgi:hypothetical protein
LSFFIFIIFLYKMRFLLIKINQTKIMKKKKQEKYIIKNTSQIIKNIIYYYSNYLFIYSKFLLYSLSWLTIHEVKPRKYIIIIEIIKHLIFFLIRFLFINQLKYLIIINIIIYLFIKHLRMIKYILFNNFILIIYIYIFYYQYINTFFK